MDVKPYYKDDFATIYHADCRDILPQLPKVDLVLTDPPYGVQKAEWDHDLPIELLHMAATLATTLAVMPGISNLATMPRFFGALRYQWTMSIRISNGMTRSPIGFGNWIACLVYSSGSIFCQDQDAGEISIRGEKVHHPSPKPIESIVWILRRLTGGTILDPFMGSGTTLVAAKQLGRKAIGIEIEEKYCEISAKRLQQEYLPLNTTPTIKHEEPVLL
jgi:DNA modification methylase